MFEFFSCIGETDLSYSILHHLTKVPRFSTIAMFLSQNEKKGINILIGSLNMLRITIVFQ